MTSRVVVLLSGSGTLLQALLEASSAPGAAFEIVAVGSDRADAYGLTRALDAGVLQYAQATVFNAARSHPNSRRPAYGSAS